LVTGIIEKHEGLFAEQAAAWVLTNAPRISAQVALARTNMIKGER
jgi:hypothetical protein